jgi:hypothetical protein
MPTVMALCGDEATIVLCSRLADSGFQIVWAHTEDVRQGRVEPEALVGDEPPALILYEVDGPEDESLLLLTLFRSLPGMGSVPVVLVRGPETAMPPLDTPGVVAVLTRPCRPALAHTIITTALRDPYGEAA